jgi:hypothetical protein
VPPLAKGIAAQQLLPARLFERTHLPVIWRIVCHHPPIAGLNLGIGLAPFASAGAAAATTNFHHVLAMLTDNLTALATGLAGFVSGELVGGAFFVSRLSAFTRDFALATRVH